ncbi:hypothetical protein VKT23_011636 [Stygiomarasmius scandens]|uniref:Uncharacterized protein n=1 Tax=Marasmiellus scandens TaxID=2682957 RepID=A0ABR1J7N0_9AGAR
MASPFGFCTATPYLITTLERHFETVLLSLLSRFKPNLLQKPPFHWVQSCFRQLPDSLVRELWDIINHLFCPGTYCAFVIIYSHCFSPEPVPPSFIPPSLTLKSLKASALSARGASFSELVAMLDRMSQWIGEATATTQRNDKSQLGLDDERAFWFETGKSSRLGSPHVSRGRDHEGSYGEQNHGTCDFAATAKAPHIIAKEVEIECRLLAVLSTLKPDIVQVPSFPYFQRSFSFVPDTLVWKLWGIIDHLFHSPAWTALGMIYPHLPGREMFQPNTVPLGLSLRGLQEFARKNSFFQLAVELHRMTQWVEEVAVRLVIGPRWHDPECDSRLFWNHLESGTYAYAGSGGARARRGQGIYCEEGPYGERRVVRMDMTDLTASIRLNSSVTTR